MKRVLIAAGIGIVLTILIGVAAGLAGAACHCSTPLKVFFPFETLFGSGDGTLDGLLLVLQFPAYSVIIAIVSLRLNGVWTALTLLALLGIHFVGALMAAQPL